MRRIAGCSKVGREKQAYPPSALESNRPPFRCIMTMDIIVEDR